jgi:hypothetical protein
MLSPPASSRFAAGGYSLPMRLDFWTELGSFNMIACMMGSGESLHYYGIMRRRAPRLADPLLTNRFLLWGLGIGSAGVSADRERGDDRARLRDAAARRPPHSAIRSSASRRPC